MHHLRLVPLLLLALVHPGILTAGPTRFLANEGQWDPAILFKGHSATANVSFLYNGISFSQVEPENEEEEQDGVDHHAAPEFIVWNMLFTGMEAGVRANGEEGRPSVNNFLFGNDPSRWVVHPVEYERIVYKDLYTGIDLQFRSVGMDLEYDYTVHPGAEISRIRNTYRGITALAINAAGELVVTTSLGLQVQRAPVSWQVIDGVRRPVQVGFVLYNDSTFGFAARTAYDPTVDLIIDPLFEMVWSSYTRALGISNNINYCFGQAMDAQGNVYLTGFVDGTFPVTPGAYSGPGNIVPEVFVAKYSADGSTLLYSTCLPGNSSEAGTSIAVDALGRAYVTGVVSLNITGITNFPSTPNAYQPVHSEGSDAFLTVLDPTGSSLVYSSFLGGTGGETGFRVVLGGTGIAYITGTTSIGNFPEVAATNYPSGDNDLFVAKFDIAQSGPASLIYSVRIGAGGTSNSCNAHGLAVDAAGNAYVTGSLSINFGTSAFPVTPGAYNSVYNGGWENGMCYLLKLGNTLPVSLEYCTYLGPGSAASVDVDPTSGEAYVTGGTRTFTFPTTPGAMQTVHGQDALGNPNSDVFVLKMNASGTDLIYSTFLGGEKSENATDLVVNAAGEAYVVGMAYTDFPISPGAFQEENPFVFATDLFVAHLNATGTGYACGGATYVGGEDVEYYGSHYDYYAPDVDLLPGAQDTLSVAATSHSLNFPTTPGAYEEDKVNGIADQPVFFKMTCSVDISAPPVAAFTPQIAATCTGASVDFLDVSTNGANSWQWTFSGGTPTASSEQDPQDIVFPPGDHSVSLIACNAFGCDTLVQVVSITPAPPPTVTLGDDIELCTGQSTTLAATPGLASYAWQFNNALLPDTTASITVDEAGSYSVIVSDAGGCSATDTVDVTVLPAPSASFGYEVPEACDAQRVVFTADAVNGAGYAWVFGDGAEGEGLTEQHTYPAPGTYTVTLTVTLGPCAAVVQELIDVPASSGVLVSLGNDTTLCPGAVLTLEATPGFVDYAWSYNGATLPFTTSAISISEAGDYVVQVSDTAGCTGGDTLSLSMGVAPDALFAHAQEGACASGLVHFFSNAAADAHLWSFGDGGQGTGPTAEHAYVSPGTYTVQLTVSEGPCSATSIQEITVAASAMPAVLSMPNVFSPNGDGINDRLCPAGLEDFGACYALRVYNRWGQDVFNSDSASTCWNGTDDDGDLVPDGVYYYILKLGELKHSGHVQVLR